MHNVQSPRADDQGIEAEIQAKGLLASRVTLADIEANIVSEHYFTGKDAVDLGNALAISGPALALLTFCILVTRNGFTATGESACASPENFDEELGRKIARANAINKMWPLLGYQLKERMYQLQPTNTPAE